MTSPLLQAAARAWIYGERKPWAYWTTRDVETTLAAFYYLRDTRENA